MWVQQAGGWTSAKMLLDVYGHYMPTETRGFADVLTATDGAETALDREPRQRAPRRATANAGKNRGVTVEPTIRIERTTCSLRDPEEPEE
jgi:hypothetical protein